MGALSRTALPRRIKEILHRQKETILRARAIIRRQAEELELLRLLLGRRLGVVGGAVVEVGATLVDVPELDKGILLAMPAAKGNAQA